MYKQFLIECMKDFSDDADVTVINDDEVTFPCDPHTSFIAMNDHFTLQIHEPGV